MERAVRRSELRSPESSPEPAPDPDTLERWRGLADFDYVAPKGVEQTTAAVAADGEDEELEFQLFATAKPAADKTAIANKIRLRSPTPQTTDPGFVNAERPLEYYFADSTNRDSYSTTALSGSQVSALSKTPWPGSTYPWKVLHLPSGGQTKAARLQANMLFDKLVSAGAEEGSSTRRKRLGKKARIKIRTKLQAARSKAEQAKMDANAKEAALKEKRTRLNREKKIKKRAKEKAKKAEGKEEG